MVDNDSMTDAPRFYRTAKFERCADLPAGPWRDEPDKAQWVDPATGLDCLIVRNHGGSLCGYVGLPPGHPLHGVGYDEAYEHIDDLSVHGGLTFADSCHEKPGGDGICHVPEAGRPDDVWWLGFDTAHCGDLTPADGRSAGYSFSREERYRDIGYVRDECMPLAEQLSRATT